MQKEEMDHAKKVFEKDPEKKNATFKGVMDGNGISSNYMTHGIP